MVVCSTVQLPIYQQSWLTKPWDFSLSMATIFCPNTWVVAILNMIIFSYPMFLWNERIYQHQLGSGLWRYEFSYFVFHFDQSSTEVCSRGPYLHHPSKCWLDLVRYNQATEIWRVGCFINAYELFTLKTFKIQLCLKIVSFNVWVRYFVWNFKGSLWNSTQNILPIHSIHWKMCI